MGSIYIHLRKAVGEYGTLDVPYSLRSESENKYLGGSSQTYVYARSLSDVVVLGFSYPAFPYRCRHLSARKYSHTAPALFATRKQKRSSFRGAGAKKPRYCSKECQKKDWPSHKKTCSFEGQNREDAKGALGASAYARRSNIKKWFSKHTQLLVYVATHAMRLHDPSRAAMLKTHMFVINLEPASLDNETHANFTFKSATVCSMREHGLSDEICAGLLQRVTKVEKDRRYSLTMFVRSGDAVYVAPITIPRCNGLEHAMRFGPPDDGWEGFLERAINNTLEDSEGDRFRVECLKDII